MNPLTPTRYIPQNSCSPVLEQSLVLNKYQRTLKNSLFWGGLNSVILAALVYDLSETCPFYFNYYHYAEYFLILVLTVNILYYAAVIVKLYFTKPEQIAITLEQKKLLGIKGEDPNYKVVSTPSKPLNVTPTSTPIVNNATPMNLSAVSWMSNRSQGDSLNYSMSSPSWSYHNGSSLTPDGRFSGKPSPTPYSSPTPPVITSSYRDTSSIEFINDEASLQQYLREQEESEKIEKQANKSEQSTNLLSSFWSHPVTKTAKDMSLFLKKCQYQLSSQSPSKLSTGSPGSKAEDKNSKLSETTAMEVWTKLNVNIVVLTQWNENLRMWISMTILERLVKEFDVVNETFEKHGMNDIKIGSIGLDRLRKTAQMTQVVHFLPSLPTLIPFLEVHANQEYLEKRIRELAKGGCMSEFKWNGGSSYNGKEWDDSLPTDCAIVMHLFASYMDTQLMPSPNMPDTKAFSGHHFIRSCDKMPFLASNSLFVQEVSEKPPHYRVVIGTNVYELAKGYNNLFHSILFFIYQVDKREHGMLGRVNLGRAGINILWVIGQDN